MTPLILQAGWRQLTRYRGQWLLSVFAIALGVAVVVAVDLANQSALRAFDAAHRILAGEATHQLIGAAEGVADERYRWLRLEYGLRRAAPVVEGRLRLVDQPRRLTLLGVDPFAEAAVRGYAAASGGDAALARLIAEPDTALLAPRLARELELARGERFAVRAGDRQVSLTLVGELPDEQPALTELVVVDIATAQELLGQPGRLSRVDLVLSAGQAAALAAELPPELRLIDAREQSLALGELTAAFRLNLTALSLLALLVGLFLIYNTLSFALVRRRPIIGCLRALGVTRGEVLTAVLIEAALLGAIGTILGIALGIPMAQGLVHLVGRTVEALYYEQAVLGLVLAPGSLIRAALLGLAGSVIAAVLPAREAASLPPRAALSRASLESSRRGGLARAGWLGLLLLALGGLWLWLAEGVVAGFAGLFLTVLGAALWVPLATVALMTLLGPLLARLGGLTGRLAGRGVTASLSRTGVAVTALAVAVSAVVGVGVMIHSFRVSVTGWLEQTLRADLYLSADTAGARSPLSPELAARIRALPAVAELNISRRLQLSTTGGPVELWALEPGQRTWAGFEFLQGDSGQAWTGFHDGGLIVSEAYAYHHGLTVGESLSLPARDGPRAFPVVGVYRDYGSDRGVVAMSAETSARHFGRTPPGGFGIHRAPGTDATALAEQLQILLKDQPGVRLNSQQSLKRRSLDVFDQTFAITRVLRLLAGAVAFAGVLAALAALQLERARELAVLRATGFTPGQLAGLSITQSGLLGLAAGLCALPLGLLLSILLVHVILRRAFGWTMAYQVPAGVLLEGLMLAVAAALLAALYPAWRSYRAPPARALQEEP